MYKINNKIWTEGWCIKKFDEAFQDKIPTGFEMLINNFSAGILGGILAILAYAIHTERCSLWSVCP